MGSRSVAEAALQGTKNLVTSIKDMNKSSKSMHERLMEMELQLHEQTMKYKVEKDEQLEELACIFLLNQATVANAMVTMVDAVKTGYRPIAALTHYSTPSTRTSLENVISTVQKGRICHVHRSSAAQLQIISSK